MWRNQTLRKADDHKDHDKLRGCFYRGRVRGDEHSSVTVSLCDGMVCINVFTDCDRTNSTDSRGLRLLVCNLSHFFFRIKIQ